MATAEPITPSPGLVAVGLARCSTDGQDKSIEQQTAEMLEWATASGHQLVEVFEDEGISGSELDRPGIRALLSYLETSQDKGTVVCWKRNRLARPTDPRDGLVLERQIERTGWRLHFLQGAQASGNALVDTLLGVIEHHEAGEFLRGLAIDTVRGQLARLLAGEMAPTGRVPYGYAKEVLYPDGEVKRFARRVKHRTLGSERAYLVTGDPREVETVQRIFERYATGRVGLANLARELNEDRIPSSLGKRWLATSVRCVISNPVYVGDLVWNKISLARFVRIQSGKVVKIESGDARLEGPRRKPNDASDWITLKDHHAPLVSRDLFGRANEILKGRGDKQGGQRLVDSPYALTGLVYCVRCGFVMGGRTFNSNGHTYRRYGCTGYGRAKLCECYLIDARKLEAAVATKLREAYCSGGLSPEKLRKAVLRALRKVNGSRRRGGRKRASFERERTELETKIQQAIENMGVVSATVAEAIGRQIETWSARCEEIAAELAQVSETEPAGFDPVEVAGDVADLLHRIDSLSANTTSAERRELMQATIERIDLRFETTLPTKGRKRKKHTFLGGEILLRPLFPDGSSLCVVNRSSTTLKPSIQTLGRVTLRLASPSTSRHSTERPGKSTPRVGWRCPAVTAGSLTPRTTAMPWRSRSGVSRCRSPRLHCHPRQERVSRTRACRTSSSVGPVARLAAVGRSLASASRSRSEG